MGRGGGGLQGKLLWGGLCNNIRGSNLCFKFHCGRQAPLDCSLQLWTREVQCGVRMFCCSQRLVVNYLTSSCCGQRLVVFYLTASCCGQRLVVICLTSSCRGREVSDSHLFAGGKAAVS